MKKTTNSIVNAATLTSVALIMVVTFRTTGVEGRSRLQSSVQEVVDGGTVVISGLGPQRLWGVSAPTGDASGAIEAWAALERMVSRTTIRIESREGGVILYGSNNVSLNYQLVADGLVRHSIPSSDPLFSQFDAAQRQATFASRVSGAPSPVTLHPRLAARWIGLRHVRRLAVSHLPVAHSRRLRMAPPTDPSWPLFKRG
jgi:hypothetical protein